MPSPIGHMLGGVAAAWLVAGRQGSRSPAAARPTPRAARPWPRATLVFAVLGAAPDLDLLIGAHSTYTHSVGAALVTGAAVLAWTWGRQTRLALACAAAVASHILLDWLGTDTTPPIGIMALWPLTRDFYQSPFFVFHAISRRWRMAGFFAHNSLAVLRELAILVPAVALVGWGRRWRAEALPHVVPGGRRPGRRSGRTTRQ